MTPENLLWVTAISFFIGGALKDFFQAINHDLVTPIAAALFGSVNAESFVVTVGGVKLRIGDVLTSTLSLLVALTIVAVTLPYLRAYAPVVGGRR